MKFIKVKTSLIVLILIYSSCALAQNWKKHTRLANIDEIVFELNDTVFNYSSQIYNYYKNSLVDTFLINLNLGLVSAVSSELGELISKNIYKYPDHEEVTLNNKLTWSENPLNSRNWEFYHHCLISIKYLINAHRIKDDDRYIKKSKKILSSWVKLNMVDESPSSFTWYDHSTCMRLQNVLTLYEYLKQINKLDKKTFQNILQIVNSHARILASSDFYVKRSNHGLYQSYIMHWTCMKFKEIQDFELISKTAHNRVLYEVGYNFNNEGVHVENSPKYHYEILNLLTKIDAIYKYYGYQDFSNIINNGLVFLNDLIKPNGWLPRIGDTYEINVTEDVSRLKELYSGYPNFKMLHKNLGIESEKPIKESFKVYKESGYAIYNSNNDNYLNSTYILFKAGFLSFIHRHDDFLSFVLFAKGEDWFIDGGLYNYNKCEKRDFIVSNRAHNVLIVNNRKMSWSWKNKFKSKIDSAGVTYNHYWVKGSHELYPGFKVSRELKVLCSDSIICIDSVDGRGSVNNKYQVLFNIPKDKEVIVDGNECIIKGYEYNLKLTIDSDSFVNSTVVSGVTKPVFQGWTSYTFDKLVPCQTLIIEYEGDNLSSGIKMNFEVK